MTPPSPQPPIVVVDSDADYYAACLAAEVPGQRVLALQPGAGWTPDALAASGLIAFGRALEGAPLARMPNLRWVQALSSGVDKVLALPGLPVECTITSCHGVHGPAVSEMALLHMLALSRGLPGLIAQRAERSWHRPRQPLLHGKTAVVLGSGVIASALGLRCQALGMHTVCVASQVRPVPGFAQVLARTALQQAAAMADFLVALLPLDAHSRHIVNARVLEAMRPTAYFINVARGGVCDEGALLLAVRAGRIAGAGLDVFATEPLPPGHPLWDEPRILLTPHLAGESDRYADQVMPVLKHNLRCHLEGNMDSMLNRVTK